MGTERPDAMVTSVEMQGAEGEGLLDVLLHLMTLFLGEIGHWQNEWDYETCLVDCVLFGRTFRIPRDLIDL